MPGARSPNRRRSAPGVSSWLDSPNTLVRVHLERPQRQLKTADVVGMTEAEQTAGAQPSAQPRQDLLPLLDQEVDQDVAAEDQVERLFGKIARQNQVEAAEGHARAQLGHD